MSGSMAQDFRYLAYGSNLVAGGLCRYVGAIADHAVGERVTIPGWHLRFQGHSIRWDGSAATFAPDPDGQVTGRAWPLDRDSLIAVVAGEAGVAPDRAGFAVDLVLEAVAADARASPWTAPVTRPISQYDTVVAIDHPDGLLWTVTASVPDVLRRRCEPYLAQVHLGLTDLLGRDGADDEIEAALDRSSLLPPGRPI